MPAIRHPFVLLPVALMLAGCGPGAGPVPWPTMNGGADDADLVETGFSSTPDHFILGQEATVHVTVTNTGRADAGTFEVEFAVTPNGHRVAWPRARVAGLAAGATTIVDFVVEVTSSMDVPIEIVIDPGHEVPEASETNNISHHVAVVTVPG